MLGRGSGRIGGRVGGANRDPKIRVKKVVKIKRLGAFIPHKNLGLQSIGAEVYSIDQAKVVRPLLPHVDGEVLGAEAEVDLD